MINDKIVPIKCGYIAVVGLPNTGKSTLVNHFLKEKLSIVSPKPQTTRSSVTCILSSDSYQIIFVDTPGILKPKYKMQEVMVSYIEWAINNADVIMLIVDTVRFKQQYPQSIVDFARETHKKKIVVALNKIDMIKKEKLLPIIQVTSELFPGADIVPISALNGDGTERLFSIMLDIIPFGPKLYPDDSISIEPERFFVGELIRESLFLLTEDEVPYSTAVLIDTFDEKKDPVVIHASIFVEKSSQKPIIIGKNGEMIKKIGIQARAEIERFLRKDVYLDLHVRVERDWRNNNQTLRELGLIKSQR